MSILEFQTTFKDGVIQIPEAYQAALAEGIKVRVIVVNQKRDEQMQSLKALLKETQSLPQSQTITEAEIAAEIEAYRSGQ